MKTSDQGLDLLMQREGSRNTAYQDSVGVWTIGVGHTGPDVFPGLELTDDQVKSIFANDISRFEDAVNSAVQVELAQNQFDALVSFSFNVGTGAFRTSTMVRLLNQGDFADIPAQFDRWHIPAEITQRRNGEREQFKGTHFVATWSDT